MIYINIFYDHTLYLDLNSKILSKVLNSMHFKVINMIHIIPKAEFYTIM